MPSDHPNQIGPYCVDREIGRGGMGVVYFGHDSRLNRDVAIKSLPEHLAADPDRLTRFEREARTLASLSHPNIAMEPDCYAVHQSPPSSQTSHADPITRRPQRRESRR